MMPNPFDISAEASQHDKSAIEKENAQKLIVHKSETDPPKYKRTIVWKNVIAISSLHIGAAYGLYLLLTSSKYASIIWFYTIGCAAGFGITAGAHRLWAHRTYKAKWPLRFLLMLLQTAAVQNHIYEWVRDHRVHHKFTDTDADPHNAKRGFFFSHMGWLLVRKHPDVIRKGATVDMSDLEQDPIVVWQRRFYYVLVSLLAFIIPIWIPIYFWNENPMVSVFGNMIKYVIILHSTWLVNSVAHIWGMKPYDSSIGPTENIGVAIAAFGEGWHNYHHVFPWDYKTAELGNYRSNATTAVIDFFARIGWAYDMKTVPAEIVEKRAARTGDGSIYPNNSVDTHSHNNEKMIWGLEDPDAEEFRKMMTVKKSK